MLLRQTSILHVVSERGLPPRRAGLRGGRQSTHGVIVEPWPEAVGILAQGRASPGQKPCAGYLSWPCERCSSRFGAGVTLPQPACRQPVAKLGGRLAGADVEEHQGRDEAYDLAAKRAAKNTLRAKLVQK